MVKEKSIFKNKYIFRLFDEIINIISRRINKKQKISDDKKYLEYLKNNNLDYDYDIFEIFGINMT